MRHNDVTLHLCSSTRASFALWEHETACRLLKGFLFQLRVEISGSNVLHALEQSSGMTASLNIKAFSQLDIHVR